MNGHLEDFTPGQDPARPVPAAGSDEARHVAAVITGGPAYTLLPQQWVPAWNRRLGTLGRAPGWYIIGSVN